MLTSQGLQFYGIEHHKISFDPKTAALILISDKLCHQTQDEPSHIPWYSGITFAHREEVDTIVFLCVCRILLQYLFYDVFSKQDN